jgi:hypothetical protein
MNWILAYYLLQVILLKGEANDDIPEGFIKTEEVNIDPQTKAKQRVYYHPETGERIYRIEGEREDSAL